MQRLLVPIQHSHASAVEAVFLTILKKIVAGQKLLVSRYTIAVPFIVLENH